MLHQSIEIIPSVKTVTGDIDQRNFTIDQKFVAAHWAKTLYFNSRQAPQGSLDSGTNLVLLLISAITAADFKTRSDVTLEQEYGAPSDKLNAVDYLSHGSRIIIDYQNLTEKNRSEYLAYLEPITEARTSTHAVHREATTGAVHETKGIAEGLKGIVKNVTGFYHHFGVNLAIGGINQQNLIGKTIKPNGYSGHLFVYKNDDDKVSLVGIEQSAPQAMTRFLSSNKEEEESIQAEHDQFGQTHSLTGAADTYTALGSRYFNDPEFMTKCLAEEIAPPAKYNGMRLILTDDNWGAVKQALAELVQQIQTEHEQKYIKHLARYLRTLKPKQTSQAGRINYLAIEFESYLTSISKRHLTANNVQTAQILAGQAQVVMKLNEIKAKTSEQLSREGTLQLNLVVDDLNKLLTLTEQHPQYNEGIKRLIQVLERQINTGFSANLDSFNIRYQQRKKEEQQQLLDSLLVDARALKEAYQNPYLKITEPEMFEHDIAELTQIENSITNEMVKENHQDSTIEQIKERLVKVIQALPSLTSTKRPRYAGTDNEQNHSAQELEDLRNKVVSLTRANEQCRRANHNKSLRMDQILQDIENDEKRSTEKDKRTKEQMANQAHIFANGISILDFSKVMSQAIEESQLKDQLNDQQKDYLRRKSQISTQWNWKATKEHKKYLNLLKCLKENDYEGLCLAAQTNTGVMGMLNIDNCIKSSTTGRKFFHS